MTITSFLPRSRSSPEFKPMSEAYMPSAPRSLTLALNPPTSAMRPYPLYDELVRRVEARTDKCIDIKRVCTTINNIPQSMSTDDAIRHHSEIAALILHYDIVHNGGILTSPVPYEGRVMAGGKGILHYLTNLPPLLQQILAQYIEDSAKE